MKKTTKHSEGEWVISKPNSYIFDCIQISSEHRTICETYSVDEEDQANAKLIVASPILLDVLMRVLKDDKDYPLLQSTKNKVINAIKKATE